MHQLEKDQKNQAELKSVVLAERVDAQLNISIDPSKVIARAKIISAYGGQAITLDQITQEMKKLNITHGILDKTLYLLIKKSKNSKPGSHYQAIIAEGKKAVNGCDAAFKRLVEIPNERLIKPQEKADGHIDMRDLGQLVTVKPGTPLMQKIPHQTGTPGLTITNELIKQIEGKDFEFNIGENTELAPDNKNLLIAAIAGVPQALHNGMKVDDALIVNNVDVGFGHIDYDGSVIIAGDICDGMKVKATGDVTVVGFIESAKVECAGDLFVGKGILGHKRGGDNHLFSCEITCQGSVTAGFSQYTKMHIEKDLHIKNQLLHCSVFCKGHICVKNDIGNKGVILGGLLCAYKGISTITLGAPAGTKTLIDLIGIYPKLIELEKQLNNAIQQAHDKLFGILQAQQKLSGSHQTEKTQTLNIRLIMTQEETEKQLLILNSQLEENLIARQKYTNVSKVIALKELHGHVIVSIGHDVLHSQRTYGPTRIRILENKLIAEPYSP
ncbi:MAG: FapA family protein [Psychromonas sp.]|nr:FapA family protein [Psychromonas sp.]